MLGFDRGSRDVIWALEGLALNSDLFVPAAKLVLQLAEAETENWTNNATGVFASLFSLGYGNLAPTSLAPEHRLPVLVDALRGGRRRSEIALKAFETALAIQSTTRSGTDQPFHFGKSITRWTPKTYGEWYDAYASYWRTLKGALIALPPNLKERAVAVLLSRARELLRVETMRVEILDTITTLGTDPDVDKRAVISTIETILEYDRDVLPPEVNSRLVSLRDEMIGASFHSCEGIKMPPIEDRMSSIDFARTYEASAEQLTGPFSRSALAMVGDVGPGVRVLDVAAGTGALSLPATERRERARDRYRPRHD